MKPEPYIAAASALATAAREKRYGSVVLAGISPGEGTSTAALEVVRAMQHNFGLRAALLEWNRRRPVYAGWLSLDPARGLASLAEGGSALRCLQQTSDGLQVLPFGPAAAHPAVNGLHPLLCRTLRELESQFPMVVIDAPPLLESADALAAASLVRQVVLVVQAGRNSYEQLQRVRQRLESDGVAVVGAILTERKRPLPRWLERIVGA